jgi:hypothetical protein
MISNVIEAREMNVETGFGENIEEHMLSISSEPDWHVLLGDGHPVIATARP